MCPGCDRVGCLDTVISGRVLPNPLSSDDERYVAKILRLTLERFSKDAELVVLAGGVVKTNPGILRLLEKDGPGGVEGTAAPPGQIRGAVRSARRASGNARAAGGG